MNDRLEDLKRIIEAEAYKEEAAGVEPWGGADLIIAPLMDKRLQDWLDEQPVIMSSQRSKPQRQAVITKHYRELSWLFSQLKKIYAPDIDYVSKYDFYGMLGLAARRHIEENPDSDCRALLLVVVAQAERWVNGVKADA